MDDLASFWKPEACGQTVLPDRSIFIGQKLMENAKIEKLNFRAKTWKDWSFKVILKHCVLLPQKYSRMEKRKPWIVFFYLFWTRCDS